MSIEDEIFPIEKSPTVNAPDGYGWSVDIILISGKKERVGYYDPYAGVTGGKYLYYKKDEIIDCAELKKHPTHWKYPNTSPSPKK